jgi:sugar transferase EpsL
MKTRLFKMETTSLINKRVIDVVGSASLLLLTSPVLLAASVAVLLTIGRPAWFRQLRSGLNGKPFYIYKIRTMRAAPEHEHSSEHDAKRLTRLGALLRRSSIDELPQFWNVLRGQMSLVGPRPLLFKYVARYSARQRRRLEAKPGITGIAQIGGRNGITWEERFDMDLWYIQHQNVWLDVSILLRTPGVVFRMGGTCAPGHATIREFMNAEDAPGPPAPLHALVDPARVSPAVSARQ